MSRVSYMLQRPLTVVFKCVLSSCYIIINTRRDTWYQRLTNHLCTCTHPALNCRALKPSLLRRRTSLKQASVCVIPAAAAAAEQSFARLLTRTRHFAIRLHVGLLSSRLNATHVIRRLAWRDWSYEYACSQPRCPNQAQHTVAQQLRAHSLRAGSTRGPVELLQSK